MTTWHEHQAALQDFNSALELEGNRYGPVHPRWKEHNEVLQRHQESVASTFHAAAAAEGLDPVAHTRAALESAYDRQVSQYDRDASSLDSAIGEAKRMKAAQAVERLRPVVGDYGWQVPSKAKLMTTAAERRDAAVAARDTLIQRPHSVHADQSEIAEQFPEQYREHVQRLPHPVIDDLRNRAREGLRPASQR